MTDAPVVNPLLARIQMPGETFTLPSRGVFYKNGELAEDTDGMSEVHVSPMSVIDEITLKTPDKLFSGKAVEEVFARCIPQVLKPGELLAKDVDFLMLCLRKVSYGSQIEFVHRHEGCPKAELNDKTGERVGGRHRYNVEINQFIQGSQHIDPTSLDRIFVVQLESGQKVHMNPIRYKDFITMLQAEEQEGDVPVEEQMRVLIDSLLSVIEQVDEVTDDDMIREWIAQLRPGDLKVMNTQLHETIKWGPDFMYKISCKDCGETLEVVAPQNPLVFFS